MNGYQHFKRFFRGETARFPTLNALPSSSNYYDHDVANLSVCRRITQPIGIMREWKRSGKAVSTKCYGADSSDPNSLSSKVNEPPKRAVERSTPSRWSDSEERAGEVMRSKGTDDVFVKAVERILRAFPHWYPRNSLNCSAEILKRIPFEMSLSFPTTTPLDLQDVPTCSRAPLSRPVSFRDQVCSKQPANSDSRCRRQSSTRQSVYLTDSSYGNLSPVLDQCDNEFSTMRERSLKKRSHQLSLEEGYFSSPLECQWHPETYDNPLGEKTMPGNSSGVCTCIESVEGEHWLAFGCSDHFEIESPVVTETFLLSCTKAGTSKLQKPAVENLQHEPTKRSSVSEYLDKIDTSLLTSPLEPRSVGTCKRFGRDSPSFQSDFRYYQHRMF
ncbi:hypothetical protein TTRE_0000602901 [Trichuris trichiura]|uniref:Uncharacterized protein n=1 Tax=Trichuris trichiura TaxID=36087 RepID=A0A077ZD20_TRITR|nr:hypothetical protein TTRE_0000602901 [Trichuris trichiura]